MLSGSKFPLIAPEVGKVKEVRVSEGEFVLKDQPLLLVESMKLQV